MEKPYIFLVQTDTTVGFLCKDAKKIAKAKNRPVEQKILQTLDSFSTLKQNTRVPKKFKNKVRKSKNTTFIYPNGLSFRVVDKSSPHYNFIKKFKSTYSSSANQNGQSFEENFAKEKVDIVVEDKRGFFETKSSQIFKINKVKIKKVR